MQKLKASGGTHPPLSSSGLRFRSSLCREMAGRDRLGWEPEQDSLSLPSLLQSRLLAGPFPFPSAAAGRPWDRTTHPGSLLAAVVRGARSSFRNCKVGVLWERSLQLAANSVEVTRERNRQDVGCCLARGYVVPLPEVGVESQGVTVTRSDNWVCYESNWPQITLQCVRNCGSVGIVGWIRDA